MTWLFQHQRGSRGGRHIVSKVRKVWKDIPFLRRFTTSGVRVRISTWSFETCANHLIWISGFTEFWPTSRRHPPACVASKQWIIWWIIWFKDSKSSFIPFRSAVFSGPWWTLEVLFYRSPILHSTYFWGRLKQFLLNYSPTEKTHAMWHRTTKPIISSTGIFVAIAKNTL